MNKNKLIGELAARCVALNCDTLHVFFRYYGHTNQFEISYFMGGWASNADSSNLISFYTCDYAPFECHELLDDLQTEHDKLYAPENLAATQEAARLAKIAELQKQIEELS